MISLVTAALLLVADVKGNTLNVPRRVWRRDTPLRNDTILLGNNSLPTTSTSLTAPLASTSSPAVVPFENATTPIEIPSCVGSVTYTGSIYPTVFLTVTEGFEVTLTASNASLTASATLVTPPPACEATVVPDIAHGSFAPLDATGSSAIATIPVATISVLVPVNTTSTLPESSLPSGGIAVGTPKGHPGAPNVPATAPDEPPPEPPAPNGAPALSTSVSTQFSTIFASEGGHTSTVIVTFKTPIPVVQPATSDPPIFGQPTVQSKPPPEGPTSHQNRPGDGKDPPSSPINTGNNNPPPASNPHGPSATPNGAATPVQPVVNPQITIPAAPLTPATTLFNVPVGAGQSSVVVGSQTVAIPTSGAATVRAGDQTFTINKSQIIGQGTTLSIAPLQAVAAESLAPTKVTAAPGVIITVQGTTAVVAGTTFRIGQGAPATAITVSGQRIQLGPSGVVLPSTTVTAGLVTPAPMVVESAAGLTFGVDASEVVVSGSTFRIGSGASTIRTTIGGQSLSIGPGGVAVGSSTTFKPTSVTATGANAIESGSAAHANIGIPCFESLAWLLMVLGGLLI